MRKREEDPADCWLREHDPYYTNRGRGKGNSIKYPYLTPDQERVRRMKEIPLSCIGNDAYRIDIDTLNILNMD